MQGRKMTDFIIRHPKKLSELCFYIGFILRDELVAIERTAYIWSDFESSAKITQDTINFFKRFQNTIIECIGSDAFFFILNNLYDLLDAVERENTQSISDSVTNIKNFIVRQFIKYEG
jgi:hypothetical protein